MFRDWSVNWVAAAARRALASDRSPSADALCLRDDRLRAACSSTRRGDGADGARRYGVQPAAGAVSRQLHRADPPTAEGFEANRAWARGTRDSMARFGPGQTYVNFTGEGDEDKVRASYPAETYARLAAVKGHYDPANRFLFNQNIRPAQAG
jgi:Berberine and berberine like